VQTRATFEHGRAALAAGGAHKSFRPAALEQEGGATRFVRKTLPEIAKANARWPSMVVPATGRTRSFKTQHVALPESTG
jgi:hypothetical protein